MRTVAETAIFKARVSRIWTDAERIEFCTFIAQNPEAGDVIPASGGFWLPPLYTKAVQGNIPVESNSGGIMSTKEPTTGEELGKELLEAVKQMKHGTAARLTHVALSPAAEARAKTGLSQARFAALLGVSARTLQNWEQGRTQPSGAARALLAVAEKHPDVLRDLAAQ